MLHRSVLIEKHLEPNYSVVVPKAEITQNPNRIEMLTSAPNYSADILISKPALDAVLQLYGRVDRTKTMYIL